MSTLWNNYNFISPIKCLIGVPIRVFDIRKANISVLREKGVITQSDYDSLFYAEKINREIFIGKFLGNNPEASKILSDGIIEAKKLFFEANKLEDNEVLEINNDAVYIIGHRSIPVRQVTPYIYFNEAEVYSSFYNVKNIRYFYYADRITKTEYLRLKGMSSSAYLHESFMLDFLKELFYTAQFDGAANAINLLSQFYRQYINRELDIGYYRNLNSESRFSIVPFDSYASYQTDMVDSRSKNIIDISYNEKILRNFNQLLTDKYFRENR